MRVLLHSHAQDTQLSSTRCCWKVLQSAFSTIAPLLCIFRLWNFVNQMITKGCFIVLICIPLMTSEIELLFIVLLARGFFSSKNTRLVSFARFSHCFACLFHTRYCNWISGGLNVNLCCSLSWGSPRPRLGSVIPMGAHRTQHIVIQQRFITAKGCQAKLAKGKGWNPEETKNKLPRVLFQWNHTCWCT